MTLFGNIEEKLVLPEETLLERWEGICQETNHDKWWVGVLVESKVASNPSMFIVRSAWGARGVRGRVNTFEKPSPDFELKRNRLHALVDIKRNLNRKRDYSYQGEWVKVSKAQQKQQPPVESVATNPRIDDNLISDILLGVGGQ